MGRTAAAFFLLLALLVAARFQVPKTTPNQPRSTAPSRSAFGSCSRQDQPQPLWSSIVQNKPQLWIWLGDNIYGDTEDMEELRAKYTLAKNNPGYRNLLKSCPVIGIWDDHDYGINDGGKEYSHKEESQHLMLQFLDEPTGSPRWKRQGAYVAYRFGRPGKQVKIILLDTRYFRDSLKKDANVNVPNPEGDILGEAQWRWLEDELTQSTAQIHVIGCGIQILPEEHPYEKWANFPKSRQRLLDLLVKTQPKGIILLSGDRHLAEISRVELPGYPTPIYEVTSSGLTHASSIREEPNQHRVGKLVNQLNFGVLQIHWDQKPLSVDLQVRGQDNALLLEQPVSLGE